MEARLAVLVGIDDYEKSPLKGCVRDALRMEEVLSSHADGSPNFDCHTFVSGTGKPMITRSFLRGNIEALFARPVDVALFYFAGHGAITANRGTLMATQELERNDQGVPLNEMLGTLANSPAREKIAIVDSCYSGAFGAMPGLGDQASIIPNDLALLLACRHTETAAESAEGGLLTSLVVAALEGAAANVRGRVTIADIYAYTSSVLSGWQQRPLFKASIAKLFSLRDCQPAVSAKDLRRLVEFFATPEAEKPLDPGYEPTELPRDPQKEADFKVLQSFRDAGLLAPAGGATALYYAAKDSKTCALTPLGRAYWQLAKGRRI